MIRLIKFVVLYELRLWAALFRWIPRRPVPIEPGARRFTYHRAVGLLATMRVHQHLAGPSGPRIRFHADELVAAHGFLEVKA